ncbi:cytidylyltransferase domain-containing protein [Halorubrum halophilum]|uniref:cytidylyltransferase domain-containing protein n=1 Tax=Halorubrum halophilum TaxID=413816 RepID=UPI000678F60C|nr:glycosyltransferase family protein [Halorubrum halophilum]
MSQQVVAIIQARMGSTRLPGKVMLPLAAEHALSHTIRRVKSTEYVTKTMVATSKRTADDIVARYAVRSGADVFRGSESDVLGRIHDAACSANADVIVRITGDCPLIDPVTIDTAVQEILDGDTQYAANIFDRTFPRGLDVEVFTFESFERVHEEATEPHHREHVTPYYREQEDVFSTESVTSEDVFDEPQFQNRGDLRLTLDEADDYEVLRTIYENVPFDDILPTREAIRYVDENDLMELNADVEQKSH